MLQENLATKNPLTALRKGTKSYPLLQLERSLRSTLPQACRQIQLAKITDSRGSLSFIEGENHIPFKIESARWINEDSELAVAGDRNFLGGRDRQEFIIPISGSIEVTYDNGRVKNEVRLDRPDQGLYIPNASCRQVRKLSPNSAVLILSSAPAHGFVLS